MTPDRDSVPEVLYNKTTEISSMLWNSYDSFLLHYESVKLPESFDILEYQSWIFAIIGATIVGLSGILPLLIIPVDESATLKDGAGAKTLRILLSFAVGGLLGDVFLHLLPEAWGNQYSSSVGKKKYEHPTLICGLWVLAGLLVFIIIEKIFSFEKEEDDEDKKSADYLELSKNFPPIKSMPIRRKKSSFILNDLTRCKEEGICCRTILEPLIDGMNFNNNLECKTSCSGLSSVTDKKPGSVQVSGYLNLMANSIDNFTHGLAVGGSFLLSTRVGVFTTFAILVHEIPHEVGDFAILLRAGFTRWDAAWAQVYTASAGIFGALTALIFSASASSVEARTTWILPFTAGGFLHIALVTVLPELLEEKNPKESLKQMCSLASGIMVMALLTMLVEA